MSVRLAIVRQKYRPDGGAERFISRALSELSRHEHLNLTLITRKWCEQANLAVEICNPLKWGRISRESRFAKAACQLIQQQEYDLVQSHERIACCDIYRAGDGVHAFWLRQRWRILPPWKRMAMAWSPYHRYVLNAERALFASPRLKQVICNSELVKNQIVEAFGFPVSSIEVIYNGVDLDHFNPQGQGRFRAETRQKLGLSEDDIVGVFVGSGFERKGLMAALQTLAKLPENHKLVVVGKDKNQRRYEQRAQQLGLAKRVRWTGVQNDVRPYYSASDYLFLPSLYDPFANVVFEALASGLPVVTSEQCGGVELIQQGSNGWVSDALDSEGFALGIQSLFTPEDARERLAQAARQSVLAYSQEAMVKRLTALYERLLV